MPENNVSKYAKGWPWAGEQCANRSRIKPYWYALRNPIPDIITYCHKRDVSLRRILEVGCGGGDVGIRLGIYNMETYFVDAAFSALVSCRDNNKRLFRLPWMRQKKSVVLCQDMFHLGFKDAQFDLVVSLGVYEHLYEKESRMHFLRESMRVLKKGGCLFVCIPNNAHPLLSYWKKRRYLWLDKVANPDFYEIELSGEALKKELEDAGLCDVHFDGCYLWEFVARHPVTKPRRMLAFLLKALVPEMTRSFRLKYALMLWAIGRKG